MVMAAGTRSIHHQKRHGHHQKQNKHFLKVYSPYLPLLLITLIILVFSLAKPLPSKIGVLAYATDISTSELLNQTNRQRTDNKEPALMLNPLLSRAAQDKANDMSARNYWAHNTPDGQPPWYFISKTGYDYKKAGENLAYGFSNSTATIAGWMNSPPHRENILDQTFKEVGFGIADSQNYQNTGAETIIVAMYASPGTPGQTANNSNSVHAINSDQTNAHEPPSKTIAKIQTITDGKTPWIMSVVSISIGFCLAVLLIKHGVALRRAIKKGERFVLNHVLVDLTIISLIVLGLIITGSAGIVR